LTKVKRVYDLPKNDDCFRILVDRLWPRGLSKEKAKLDLWMKEIAPTEQLRSWFNREPSKWEEFQRKYHAELSGRQVDVIRLKELEREKGTITLVFSARDCEHNNVVALRSFLERL
jgi:uncharacterized protein YeaO (DUF488 family)